MIVLAAPSAGGFGDAMPPAPAFPVIFRLCVAVARHAATTGAGVILQVSCKIPPFRRINFESIAPHDAILLCLGQALCDRPILNALYFLQKLHPHFMVQLVSFGAPWSLPPAHLHAPVPPSEVPSLPTVDKVFLVTYSTYHHHFPNYAHAHPGSSSFTDLLRCMVSQPWRRQARLRMS